jgi:GT2 family glycosyltransferase
MEYGRILAPPPGVSIEPLIVPPTFSIVIPAYLAAATIGDTVASVFAESVAPHEVIVSDDGSTDQLEEALRPFQSDLRLIRNRHAGVASARNAGCRACSGDFVLIVDADDILLPEKLASLEFLAQERPDLDLLCTDLYFEKDGRRAGRMTDANPFAVHNQRTAILKRCFVVQPAVRRTRLLEAGGFDESLPTAVDWDCWIRLVLAGAVAGLYDEPGAVYRIHPGSLTGARSRTLRDRVRILEKARAHPGLRPDERPVLERSLAFQRTRAVRAEAQAALAEGAPDARSRCLKLLRTPRIPLRERLWALAVLVSPSRVRPRLLRARIAQSQLSRVMPQNGTEA